MRRSIHLRPRGVLVLGALVAAPGCASPRAAPPGSDAQAMRLTTAEERGSFVGGAEQFTGQATVRMLFSPDGPRDFGGATATFEPGARTAWHSHPAGQTLVVTEGRGWAQLEGAARVELKAGDVLWTPPGVRHWHGATASSAMTHIALQGEVNGSVVEWNEPVSEAKYRGQDAH